MRALVAALLLGAAPPAEPPPARTLHQTVVRTGIRVHVLLEEELEPDGVRAVAQKGAVLWVRTRSNALRQSLLENLARAPDVFVQLRAPLRPQDVAQLAKIPHAGVWLVDGDLADPGVRALGPRRLAVELSGELTAERAERIARARPVQVLWRAGASPSLAAFGELARLPGVKLLRTDAPVACAPELGRGSPGVAIWRSLSAEPAGERYLPRCPYPSRVRIAPELADGVLMRLAVEDPGVELEVSVGDDVRIAYAVQKLLRRLSN